MTSNGDGSFVFYNMLATGKHKARKQIKPICVHCGEGARVNSFDRDGMPSCFACIRKMEAQWKSENKELTVNTAQS